MSLYDFDAHIAHHGLSYKSKEEYDFRKTIFDNLSLELEKTNSDPKNKNFRVGHNFLSTWTKAEKSKLRGFKNQDLLFSDLKSKKVILPKLKLNNLGFPEPFDWRTKDAVNPVKN